MKKNPKPLDGCSVGIIPDGNRRWARQKGIKFEVAYLKAMKKLSQVLDTLFELGSESVSIYALSKDNLERPRDDLAAVCRAEEYFFKELLPPVKLKYKAKVFHAGWKHLLPSSYMRKLSKICDMNANRLTSRPSVFICAAYDPFDEIVENVAQISRCAKESVLAALWVPHSIDMVIRTGGNFRISGFLPLQCKYAEFFFEPYFFPDINRSRVKKLAFKFLNRDRRFGKEGAPIP
jgi:undecaprenyl diphosphate synthase